MCINMLNTFVLETYFHLRETCWTQVWALHILHTKCIMQAISSPPTVPMLLWVMFVHFEHLGDIPNHMVISFRKHPVTWH